VDTLPRSWPALLLLIYSVAILAQYFSLQVLAFFQALGQERQSRITDRLSVFQDDFAPPISILVPAYNEGPTIVDSVRSLMQLHYPSFELIVINDGSKDDTLDQLVRAFQVRPSHRTLRARVPRERIRGVYSSPDYPFLLVLDVTNGGKATALNIGLAMARHPLFLAIDADSVLEQDTLLRLAQPFFEHPATLVVGGVVRPANGCRIVGGRIVETRSPRSHLARFQVVEYLRGMLGGRLGWERLDSLYIVSGALGLFSREAVLAAGGYRTDTLGEDMELVMRLQRWGGRTGRARVIRFVANAVAWTEVPESLGVLRRQRRRWHQGLAESLWLNRELLTGQRFRLHHGLAFLSQTAFELLGPVLEAAGYVIVIALSLGGVLDVRAAALYLGIFIAGGTLNSLMGIALEAVACPRYTRTRDLALLMLYALLENFGYRQLSVVWRLEGVWNTLRRKQVWGAMSRRGHQAGEGVGKAPPSHDAAAAPPGRSAAA
jgi:cellulose synthase/poly-beta-1,6-N-acetylglucosamine synthase-like glycosyltransferase